jgi:hypothetical protein
VIKCNKNNVTNFKTGYKLWLPWSKKQLCIYIGDTVVNVTSILVNYVTGRQQLQMVVLNIYLREKLCQETIQELLCFIYAPQYCMNNWIHLGMMLMICSSICKCKLKYIANEWCHVGMLIGDKSWSRLISNF